MEIHVASRRTSPEKLRSKFGAEACLLDLTSRGPRPWVGFSPFYPLGEIPVPFSPGHRSASVEGIWQGLKVFEAEDVSLACFENRSMKGLKRTARRLGPVRGHRRGVAGGELLEYRPARYQIYLPTYRWALEQRLGEELAALRRAAEAGPVVLLDYETNTDPEDLSRPLSHAGLVRAHLLEQWPGVGPYAVPRQWESIRFHGVNQPWGEFSNFAAFPIELDGRRWPTSEHYFQAQKFLGAPDQEEIRGVTSPMKAAHLGRQRHRPLREDWAEVRDRVMQRALEAKFTQHAALRHRLLATGEARLIEHTSNDAYWADGGDGTGANRLGLLLEDLRRRLRDSGDP